MEEKPSPEMYLAEMLTPAEIAELRRKAKEGVAYARKAFAHLRTKLTAPEEFQAASTDSEMPHRGAAQDKR